jgi:hypothetical protein
LSVNYFTTTNNKQTMSLTKHNAPDHVFTPENDQHDRFSQGGNFREKCPPPSAVKTITWHNADEPTSVLLLSCVGRSLAYWVFKRNQYRDSGWKEMYRWSEGAVMSLKQILSHRRFFVSRKAMLAIGKAINQEINDLSSQRQFSRQ